jgi:hypothetical protein
MLDEYGVTYQPGNAIEQDLVDEMIFARWRSGRLSMIVTSLLDMQMDEQRQSVHPPPRRDPARPIATAFMSLADQSKALALTLRYESRLRIHERGFTTLRELQRGTQNGIRPIRIQPIPVEPMTADVQPKRGPRPRLPRPNKLHP